jgi:hypothetical protein
MQNLSQLKGASAISFHWRLLFCHTPVNTLEHMFSVIHFANPNFLKPTIDLWSHEAYFPIFDSPVLRNPTLGYSAHVSGWAVPAFINHGCNQDLRPSGRGVPNQRRYLWRRNAVSVASRRAFPISGRVLQRHPLNAVHGNEGPDRTTSPSRRGRNCRRFLCSLLRGRRRWNSANIRQSTWPCQDGFL